MELIEKVEIAKTKIELEKLDRKFLAKDFQENLKKKIFCIHTNNLIQIGVYIFFKFKKENGTSCWIKANKINFKEKTIEGIELEEMTEAEISYNQVENMLVL